MVPQFRPQAALHMIQRLVDYESLSPLMPSNASLLEYSNKEFAEAMDKWTEYAKTMPTEL